MSPGDQRALNKAADLVNDNKSDEALPLIQKVVDNGSASKYAQAFAHQLLAQIYWDQEKGAQSIDEYKKAIAFDALPNDSQFQLVFALAQTQIQEEKYQDALATLADWEKLTGAQTADELALKANAYYRVDQFQPAVDAMKKALSMTDKPNDSWTQILMPCRAPSSPPRLRSKRRCRSLPCSRSVRMPTRRTRKWSRLSPSRATAASRVSRSKEPARSRGAHATRCGRC